MIMSFETSPFRELLRAKKFFKSNFLAAQLNISIEPKSKIRIGYFSGNFYAHPVMYQMARIFELHDQSSFEIYAYAFGREQYDSYTERVKKSVNSY